MCPGRFRTIGPIRGRASAILQANLIKHFFNCPDVIAGYLSLVPISPKALSVATGCGACGEVFTAQEPEGVGPEEYDGKAAAMIAQLKYGSGVLFHRLEQLEAHPGIRPCGSVLENGRRTAESTARTKGNLVTCA